MDTLSSILPDELLLNIWDYDADYIKNLHKEKLSKSFDLIHNLRKYRLLITDQNNGGTLAFDWGLTMWDIIDIIASVTIISIEDDENCAAFGIYLGFPESEDMFIAITEKNGYVCTDSFRYIETNLHLIGGLHNLDNFVSKSRPNYRSYIYDLPEFGVVFKYLFKNANYKSVKSVEDINETYANWKNDVVNTIPDRLKSKDSYNTL